MTEHVSKRQSRLAALLRSTDGRVRASDVMRILRVDRQQASKWLAGWHKQGVIRRVAHGLYVPVSPSALGQTQVLEDSWVLVPELYEPGYVGGWSALEYWGLTEQLFRTVCVLTNKRTSYGDTRHQGIGFYVKYIPIRNLFGTETIWRGTVKVQISDPHKTILDIIGDLNLGAGLQHTMDCIAEYSKVFDTQKDRTQLLNYARQINNGALFKKLGYLAEKLNLKQSFINECQKNLTEGYAYLDRNSQHNNLVTRWKLWVPGRPEKSD